MEGRVGECVAKRAEVEGCGSFGVGSPFFERY